MSSNLDNIFVLNWILILNYLHPCFFIYFLVYRHTIEDLKF